MRFRSGLLQSQSQRAAVVLGVALGIASALAVAPGQGRSEDLADPAGPMYSGPAELGGTISIRLTADRSAVTEVTLLDVGFSRLTSEGWSDFTESRSLVYYPPRPLKTGSFTLSVDRVAQSNYTVNVEGTIANNAFTGTATPVLCNGGCSSDSYRTITWTAEEDAVRVDPLLVRGSLAGLGGEVIVGMDEGGTELRSITLAEVVHLPCTAEAGHFSLHLKLDSAEQALDFEAKSWVGTYGELFSVALAGSTTGRAATGTLTVAFLTPGGCQQTTAWMASSVRGDSDCDGLTRALDAAVTLQFGAGLLSYVPCFHMADVNRDGRVNSVDAALVKQSLAGLIGLEDLPVV